MKNTNISHGLYPLNSTSATSGLPCLLFVLKELIQKEDSSGIDEKHLTNIFISSDRLEIDNGFDSDVGV
jgi:hypothetical protein